jgi:predicted dehydrogenase
VKLGLIGCGRIARSYLEAADRVPECELVGVVDTDETAARSVESEFGKPIRRDLQELLRAGPLDGVVVCTPPVSHANIASSALEYGLHVLCEKPLTLKSPQADGLVSRARSTDRVLMMASKFRYVDEVIKAKQIVDSGFIGEVILYENVFCSRVDMSGRWNASPDIAGGGVLIDNGTHSVDIARYLVGTISEVRAEEGRRVQQLEVEDTCRLFFRTQTGAMGAVDLSWSIHKERDAYIELFGSEGTLSIGWRGSKYRRQGDWVEFGSGYDKVAAFARQLQNFAGSIRGTEAPMITSEESLESVRVIDAAYRSMALDHWVPVAVGSESERVAG